MEQSVAERPVEAVIADVEVLIDRYRRRCLWFLRDDYYPRTRGEVLRVLRAIERCGDREAFERAASIRQWLSPLSSDTSAVY